MEEDKNNNFSLFTLLFYRSLILTQTKADLIATNDEQTNFKTKKNGFTHEQ